MIILLYRKGHSLWKLRVHGLMLEDFLYVKVINRSILLVSFSTPRNGILLLILISCVKLRTELC